MQIERRLSIQKFIIYLNKKAYMIDDGLSNLKSVFFLIFYLIVTNYW